ncbi:MAG: hypothetical protein RL330_998 [Actinomycetota bacterium]
MIEIELGELRTFLHLLGVAVWVGGQITLAGIVPRLRAEHRDSLPLVARAFARVAWSAMGVVVVTGLWGITAVDVTAREGDYLATFLIKMLLVGLAVAAALVHQLGRSRRALAIGGAVGLLASLGAMLLGVMLAHGA